MECGGQHIPSLKDKMSINFRTINNSEESLEFIRNLFSVPNNFSATESPTKNVDDINENDVNDERNDAFEYEICNEKGAAYIYLKTNLTERPIKLLIDTGASISILADDVVTKNVEIINYSFDLFGIVGKEVSVKTKGMVHAIYEINGHLLGTTIHLIDRKFSGPADGYMGYDFLCPYGVLINMSKMCIQIDLNNLMRRNFEKYELKYDECKEYYVAMNYYEKKIEDYEKIKVNVLNYGESTNTSRVSRELASTRMNENFSRSRFIFEKLKIDDCSKDEKVFIEKICNEFSKQFYIEGDKLGCTAVIKHRINIVPGSKIIHVRQYRVPHKDRNILLKMVDDLEKEGIIEKCQSNYNSPVIIIPKKDDGGNKTDKRLVIDYRKLNEVSEICSFPIPLIDDILDSLNGCSFFTTLDIKGAYYQISMEESSRDYTAFTAGAFQYRWVRMPFGLSTAPFTWQRAINTILAELLGNGVYVYLDDVIVYAKTREVHDKVLWRVMQLLRENNLQLKIAKCIFYAKQFEYLGHIIMEGGIKANPKKIEVIKDFPRPTTVKQIQSFLGLCNYFRRYVQDFAKITKPLSSLLKKEQPFIWTNTQQQAFEKLKTALTEQVVLAFPDFEQLFYVTTDASNFAIGAMLSQGELPYDRPIHFFSRTLSETQKRYSTIQKELLAIVEAIKAFRVYLYGRFFILITDHKALCYLFNMRDCGSRLFRQKLELLDYNFKILYRPGAQNVVADALSRIEPLSISEIIEKESCHALTRAQVRKELNQTVGTKDYIVEERLGTLLNKRGFDLVFHVLPSENDDLKEKLMNKFGTTVFKNSWHKIHDHQYAITISNQFSNKQNTFLTQNCIQEMLKIIEFEVAENIAINIDYDNIRHYIYFKNLFEDIFRGKPIATTFFLNKVLFIKERDDIETILNLYHKSLLGGHVGSEKMLKLLVNFTNGTTCNKILKTTFQNVLFVLKLK